MRAFVTGGSGFIGGRLIQRLRADGWDVRGLARSVGAAEKVKAAGGVPVKGDLDDVAAMRAGAEGADVFFHAAAALGEWGRREDFERGNIRGTRNALAAAREAGVRRFVHVGTEAALMNGKPLVNVDETAPLRPDSKALYSATKAQAEQAVREASGNGLETVVVRPRLVWGVGDTTIMEALADMVRSGRFRWIGGGGHLTDTTHIDNTVEGLVRAATEGKPGAAYFVTDGDPVVFRDFITQLMATQGIEIPDKGAPEGVVRVAVPVLEGVWKALRRTSPPPITRLAYWLSAQECTLDIAKARAELGYAPLKTREQGMAELREAAA
jgi:nucleoside-diphosphate-sugar epimerase